MISIFRLVTTDETYCSLNRKPHCQRVHAFFQNLKYSKNKYRAPPIFKQVSEQVLNKCLYRF